MTTKSYSYDDPNYRTTDGIAFNIAAGAAALSQKFCTFAGRQLKSVEAIQTTAGTSADVLQFVLKTAGAVALGTATATAPAAGSYNTVTLTNLGTFGSGSTAAQNFAISGGTFIATVVQAGGGTTTNTAAVIPTSYNSQSSGGLTALQGDQFWVQKGTDATAAYAGEVEFQFTPQTNFTA